MALRDAGRLSSHTIQLRETLIAHETATLVAIAGFAFAVRALFGFVVFSRLAAPLSLGADPDLWGQLAMNWVDGNGYALYSGGVPTLYRGPGYPLLVATVYVTTGSLHPGIELAQSLIGSLTCLVIYQLGRQVANRWVGYAAALMGVFYPLLVWYTPRLAYEPLFALLVSLTLLWSMRALATRAMMPAVLAGIFFGLTVLTNQTVILFPPVIAGIYLVRAGFRRIVFRQFMVISVVMGLVILPWTVRNYQLSGKFIPVHSGTITQFVKGNFEYEYYRQDPLNMLWIQHVANAEMARLLGLRNDVPVEQIKGDDSDLLMDEMAPGVEEALAPYALSTLLNQPEKVLHKILVQVPRFWYLSDGTLKSIVLAVFQGMLLLLAALGAVQMIKIRNRDGLVLVAAVVYFNLVYAVSRVEARYSTPILPAALVLGAVGLVTATTYFQQRLSNRNHVRLASPRARIRLTKGVSRSSTMRVCMVVFHYYYRDSRIRRFAEGLAEMGHSVDVLCLRDPSQLAETDVTGIRVRTLPLRHPTGGMTSYFLTFVLACILFSAWLSGLQVRRRYQVIQVHNMPDLLVLCALIPRLFGARVVLDVRDPMPEFYLSKHAFQAPGIMVRFLILQEKLSVSLADDVLTANRQFKENMVKRGAPARKITVINNLPDKRLFDRQRHFKPRSQGDGLVLLYPGTIEPRYNLDLAVRAMPIILRQAPTVTLVLLGGGSEEYRESLARLTQKLGVRDAVTILPAVSLSMVPERMSAADVGIYTALPDPHMSIATPSKVLEYAVMGLPIVSSRLPSVQEWLDDEAVLFHEPGDVEQFAANVLMLYHNPSRRKELVSRADASFTCIHRWQGELQVYLDLLHQPAAPDRVKEPISSDSHIAPESPLAQCLEDPICREQ